MAEIQTNKKPINILNITDKAAEEIKRTLEKQENKKLDIFSSFNNYKTKKLYQIVNLHHLIKLVKIKSKISLKELIAYFNDIFNSKINNTSKAYL
ncbi:MAG: hypothetical protein ACK4IX_02880 [Candidatus Sericytochromatia bacterium]